MTITFNAMILVFSVYFLVEIWVSHNSDHNLQPRELVAMRFADFWKVAGS
jgi:hypothetical protein